MDTLLEVKICTVFSKLRAESALQCLDMIITLTGITLCLMSHI